ncbi:MAG: hypothetical protein ABIJ16_10115 [Bacteroidota bacterium]
MKKLVIALILCFAAAGIFSQSPQSFSYQAVIRDATGLVIPDQNVGIRISILQGSVSGPSIYSETHSPTTNSFGLVNLEIGNGNIVSGDFATIPWGIDSYFVQVELDETGGTNYQLMGTSQLLSVPYALYAEKAGSVDSSLWETGTYGIFYNKGNVRVGTGFVDTTGRLQVMSDTLAGHNDVIFSVQNAAGDTVFAVYQEGVRLWVSDDTTGAKATGSRGGFAVGGFSPSKSYGDEFLRVTPDSVRVYIKEGSGTKATGSRGGFAVGGISPAKSFTDYYFNIEHLTGAETIDPSQPRFLWYPEKEAVIAGRVLIEDADSVGMNSVAIGFENKAIGGWSQALGFKTKTYGNYSSSIGRKTVAAGYNSFAMGDSSIALGNRSFAFGYGASANGVGSIALGTVSVDAGGIPTGNYTVSDGNYSFAAGMGARTTPTALGSIAIGSLTTADGIASSAIGCNSYATGLYASAIGTNNLSNGFYALCLGSNDTASASGAMAIGFGNTVTGQTSIAVGANVDVSGNGALALGLNCSASGHFSAAYGHYVSTSNMEGAIIIGDYSSLTVMNSTAQNQFKVRASGGYVFHANPALTELNTVYISALTGNVGIGVAAPAQKLHVKDVMRLEPRLTPPVGAGEGDMYYSSLDHKLKVFDGTLWRDCW